jgi:hypothetical protein
MPRTLLDMFDVSLDFLSQVVLDNPSLRGMILGYLAEAKLREILAGHGRASSFRKDDDHDRKKKGDLVVTYQGFEFKIEVKSLQTNSVEILDEDHSTASDEKWIRKILKKKGRGEPNPAYIPVWKKRRLDARYRGQFQCDASDKRKVEFPDGGALETTNLLFGEFHILAAGLFAFRAKWDFGFALNSQLPASANRNYPEHQRGKLITSMISVAWPLTAPFVNDIYPLLDELVAEEKAKQAGKVAEETQAVVEAKLPKESPMLTETEVKVVKKKRPRKF